MPRETTRPCAVTLAAALLAIHLISVTCTSSLEARGFRLGLIPNGFEVGCGACHESPGGGGPRNLFGADVESLVTPGGSEEFWSATLAALDSDGDGRTNGEELLDPLGEWRPGDADPGEPSALTNPGVAESVETRYLRADADGSGALNLSDAVLTLTFLFQGGGALDCVAAADANSDGQINLTDAVFTLNFLFLGGNPPGAPFPGCETHDPGEDALACDQGQICS